MQITSSDKVSLLALKHKRLHITHTAYNYDLAVVPPVWNIRSPPLNANDTPHFIKAGIIADAVVEWNLVLGNDA